MPLYTLCSTLWGVCGILQQSRRPHTGLVATNSALGPRITTMHMVSQSPVSGVLPLALLSVQGRLHICNLVLLLACGMHTEVLYMHPTDEHTGHLCDWSALQLGAVICLQLYVYIMPLRQMTLQQQQVGWLMLELVVRSSQGFPAFCFRSQKV